MYSPNELYIVFSFIGFVLSIIPIYWHLEAWNTGTCLYMFWAGLGCLLQCVNSIIWNKNMINRAPVYCDIVTRIQAAQNVAIPASSLCINRRLYKIATAKAGKSTKAEKRQAVMQDLLIGVGIPILQMVAEYIVSLNRYDIFEDFGPHYTTVPTPLTFILFSSWPLAIGTVSLYYCVKTIYTLYNRQRQFRQLLSSSQGFSRGLYFRLMALASTEILGTIPIGTYILILNAKEGVGPWESWAFMHSHYSEVDQYARVVWMNNEDCLISLEMFRWSLVVCAFVFFAFFGFADEARQHYRLVYTSLARRIGYPRSTHRGSSHVIPNNKGDTSLSVVRTTGDKCRSESSDSFADEPTVRSGSIAGDSELGFKVERPSNSVASSSAESLDESEAHTQGQFTLPEGIAPTVPLASVPPHFPEKTRSTLRAHSGAHAV